MTSNPKMGTLPRLEGLLAFLPVGEGGTQCVPKLFRVVAVEEVGDFVGDNILHGDGGGLDELPVDSDDVVFAASAPVVFGLVDDEVLGLDLKESLVASCHLLGDQ